MSSTYTSFAVVGAGSIGKHIIESLLSYRANVIVISRAASESKPIPGVETIKVEYSDTATFAAVLKEHCVQVVVAAVTTFAIDSQFAIADAAKAAGVQLFVPSEYGSVTTGKEDNMKEKIAKYIQSLGIPTARVFTGLHYTGILRLLGIPKNGKVNIIGKGQTPISCTAEVDVGGFVAHIITSLPPLQLANKEFRIQGDRMTFQEIADAFKTTTEQIDVENVPKDPLSQLVVVLLKASELGGMSSGWEEDKGADNVNLAGSSNHLWAEHHWKTVKEAYDL